MGAASLLFYAGLKVYRRLRPAFADVVELYPQNAID